MTRKNANKSFYHYCVIEFKDNDEMTKKYYMTLKDVLEDFKVHHTSINNCLKDPNRRLRKYPNFKFERVHKPRFIMVENPN